MSEVIQFRRDTAANFTSVNPTLHEGEPGFETDTGLMKIGDGSTAWTGLSYSSAIDSTSVVADAINNGTTTIAPSQNAVFDALALKQDASGTAAAAKTAAVADAINNGTTDVAPSQNAVFDALALKYTVIGGSTTDKTLIRGSGTSGAALLSSTVKLSDLDELYLYRTYEISETTTSRTLSSSVDMNCTIRTTNSSVVTITLPNSLPVGFKCRVIQGGTGQVQLSAASGAAIQNRLGYTATRDQYSVCDLEVIANSGGSAAIYSWSGDTYVASSAFSSPILTSLQQVSITIAAGSTSNTATITSVNTSKAYCHWQGQSSQITTFSANTCLADVTLTNATTVTATRNTSDASNSVTVNCTVVEFVSSAIQSIQQGTIATTVNNTSNTATISAVTTANAVVHYNGQIDSATSATFDKCLNRLVLTNTTTVTATRGTGTAAGTSTVRFVVIEFAAGVLNSATQAASQSVSAVAMLTANLTAFDPRYSLLYYAGQSTISVTADSSSISSAWNAGTTKLLMGSHNSSANAFVANWQIAEFTSSHINRITRIKNTLAATTTTSATAISSTNTVNTAKTLVNYNMTGGDTTLSTFRDSWCKVTLTDANTVTVSKNTSHATVNNYTYLEVVEFQ